MAEVIRALLDNAIRFGPTYGQVDVRVWRNNTHICRAVADQGEDIDADRLPRVFDD